MLAKLTSMRTAKSLNKLVFVSDTTAPAFALAAHPNR